MKKTISFFVFFISFCFLLSAKSTILINLNGGLTLDSATFDDNWTGDYFKESFIQNNSYNIKTGYNLGIDISYLFMKKAGFSISFEKTFSKFEGTFNGEYPHPFYFNSPRKINWDKKANFNILQADIDFIYGTNSSSENFKGFAFFGISFFQGTPGYLSSLSLHEIYPYNAVSIDSLTYNNKKYNSTGFNIGVSFYKRIISNISVGAKIKYSYGKFEIKREDDPNLKIPLQNLKVQLSFSFSF